MQAWMMAFNKTFLSYYILELQWLWCNTVVHQVKFYRPGQKYIKLIVKVFVIFWFIISVIMSV